MRITIIGGGNMGGAIACGLASGKIISPSEISVIDVSEKNITQIRSFNSSINTFLADYTSISDADVVILAVKPWLIEEVINTHRSLITPNQIVISIASGISLHQLSTWLHPNMPVYRMIPNTAIAIKESMTFISSVNTTDEQNSKIAEIFNELGKTMFIDEKLFDAVTALSSCGIAFAFRYIRAAIEGGVEMGVSPVQGKNILIQTLRGAIELLEENDSHPESEIDKVTTPGGNTIKGINEMEHAGFTSAVIKGLLASFNSMK